MLEIAEGVSQSAIHEAGHAVTASYLIQEGNAHADSQGLGWTSIDPDLCEVSRNGGEQSGYCETPFFASPVGRVSQSAALAQAMVSMAGPVAVIATWRLTDSSQDLDDDFWGWINKAGGGDSSSGGTDVAGAFDVIGKAFGEVAHPLSDGDMTEEMVLWSAREAENLFLLGGCGDALYRVAAALDEHGSVPPDFVHEAVHDATQYEPLLE